MILLLALRADKLQTLLQINGLSSDVFDTGERQKGILHSTWLNAVSLKFTGIN